MTPPTLPSLWTDTLTMFNNFMDWDIVKGFMVITIGLVLAGIALRMIKTIGH